MQASLLEFLLTVFKQPNVWDLDYQFIGKCSGLDSHLCIYDSRSVCVSVTTKSAAYLVYIS